MRTQDRAPSLALPFAVILARASECRNANSAIVAIDPARIEQNLSRIATVLEAVLPKS